MKIKIISVGKIKERYIQEGVNEYVKRLGKFCSIELLSIKDSDIKKETQQILEKLNNLKNINNNFIVVLDINGRQFSSLEFSDFIKKTEKDLIFIIGSETGLGEEVKNKAHLKLSLSRMTFLHEMTQLILLEQLYRAFSIMKNTGYHR